MNLILQAIKSLFSKLENRLDAIPDWAKQPTKPSYTAAEVGAQPRGDYALRSDLPGAVVFHISYVDEAYGYSHTVEDLYSAYQKGANITCVCDTSSVREFNLKTATDTEIVFEFLDIESKLTRVTRIVYTGDGFNMKTDLMTSGVTSVNGITPDANGNVVIEAGGGGAVDSVNGQTGEVVLDIPTDDHINSLIDAKLGVVSALVDEINGEVI